MKLIIDGLSHRPEKGFRKIKEVFLCGLFTSLFWIFIGQYNEIKGNNTTVTPNVDSLLSVAKKISETRKFEAPDSILTVLLEYVKTSGDSLSMAKVFHGYNYVQLRKQNLENPDVLEGYAATAVDIFHARGQLNEELNSLIQLGFIRKKTGNYLGAHYPFMRGLAIARSIGNEGREDYILSNLGTLYSMLGYHKRATNFHLNALSLRAKTDSLNFRFARSAYELGVVYNDRVLNDSALFFFGKSLKAFRSLKQEPDLELESKNGVAYVYTGLGRVACDNLDFTQAMREFRRALTLYRETENKEGEANTLIYLGDVYRRLGKRDSALMTFNAGYRIAKDNQFEETFRTALKPLIDLNLVAGNTEQANFLLDTLVKYQSDFDYQSRTLQIELQKEKKQLQAENHSLWLILTGILIVGLLVFLLMFLRNKISILQKRQSQLLVKVEQYQSDILKSRDSERKKIGMELHDSIGANLSAIKMYLSKLEDAELASGLGNSLEKALQLIEKSVADVRKISKSLRSGQGADFSFIDSIHELYELLIDTGKYKVELVLGDNFQEPEHGIGVELMLAIQEIVTNIIRHANATEISFHFDQQEEELKIRIADNGKGFNVEEAMKSKGIGLENIQERIEDLFGTIDIQSATGKGTVNRIAIPI